MSSTLHLPPRKVPISASCPGLLVAGLRGGLDLGPLSCLLFVASDSLSLPIDVQGFPKKTRTIKSLFRQLDVQCPALFHMFAI